MKEYKYFKTIDEVEKWLLIMEQSARINHMILNIEQLEEAEEIVRKKKNGKLLNFIGALYFEGNGVNEDKYKAFRLYEEAMDLGYYQAASNLGYCYYYGNGVRKDMYKAFKAFTRGVRLGSIECLIKLGDMYINGENGYKDIWRGLDFYEEAYEQITEMYNPDDRSFQQSYSSICLKLGKCYYNGKGYHKNMKKAERYIRRAYWFYKLRKEWNDYYCESGLKESKALLDKIYEEKRKMVC